jgi:glycosyltransferase involved in cell wall biosynthesis
MDGKIGVSVCLFTYNYEKYLAQAIDSVLAQETDFAVEIVIGDDLSKDSTREIARTFQIKYPGKIILSFNEANIGGTRNWIRTMNRCSGKYIALLDGDDYFTDRQKLQKQYDALEKDPSYVLCFHSVEEKYDDIEGKDKIVTYEKEEYTLNDFLGQGWFIRTGATFYRNGIAPAEPPEWVYDYPYRYDTILHVFLCMHGNAICLKDVMSVWRKHSKGMSYVLLEDSIRNCETEIRLARQLDVYSGRRHTSAAGRMISRNYSYLFLAIVKSGKRFRHLPLLLRSMVKMNFGIVFRSIRKKLA